MYIRVGVNRFYRLDMAGSCPALKGINPHLVTTFRGTNSICSKLDWNLKVARAPGSPAVGCIVKEMTEMTPEEVAAIPKKFKPYNSYSPPPWGEVEKCERSEAFFG
jgi:hypothetical protein